MRWTLIIYILLSHIVSACGVNKKAEIHYQDGLVHLTEMRFIKAIESFSTAIERDKYHAKAYFSRGMTNAAMSDYEPAYRDFQQAININPLMAEAHIEIGKIMLRRSLPDYSAALRSYSRAIDIQPDNAEAFLLRGILRSEMWEMDAALRDMDKHIQLSPRSYKGYFHRAKIHQRREDYSLALVDANMAIEINPSFTEAYNLRGVLHLSYKNYQAAEGDFVLATGTTTNPGKVFFYLGQARYGLKNYRGAIEAFTESLNLAPGIAVTYSERGNTWEKLGDMNKACQDWKKGAGIGNANAINNFRQKCR